MEAGQTFEKRPRRCASNVFTTHTPVPAGNDEFPLWLIDKYFANYWPKLGLTATSSSTWRATRSAGAIPSACRRWL